MSSSLRAKVFGPKPVAFQESMEALSLEASALRRLRYISLNGLQQRDEVLLRAAIARVCQDLAIGQRAEVDFLSGVRLAADLFGQHRHR
jgi:hypothetical protein